jgi:hypothetical protein
MCISVVVRVGAVFGMIAGMVVYVVILMSGMNHGSMCFGVVMLTSVVIAVVTSVSSVRISNHILSFSYRRGCAQKANR